MICLEAFAMGFFITLGVEVALGLCIALKYVKKGKKK
jgi:hypothetical protein